MTTIESTVIDNRDATRDDARALGRIYRQVEAATKAFKKADRAVADAWVGGDRDALRAERDQRRFNLDEIMDTAWEALNALPSGTVAPGGASPQTVGMHLFNRNLNRSLKARMTATEARQANKRSFA